MKIKFKSILITGLLLMSLVGNTSAVFGATSEKNKNNNNCEKPTTQSIVNPDDVVPTQKSIGSTTYYWVTQEDIDNIKTEIKGITASVSSAITKKFKSKGLSGAAAYFGFKVGSYLGDIITKDMEPGYYYNNSAQTYKFISGNMWEWQYGNVSICNEDTKDWYFRKEIAPPNIYEYGL